MTDIKTAFIASLRDEQDIFRAEVSHPRAGSVPYIPGRATTLIGVRRAGKSTWLRQIARKMVAEGEVPETAIISVNFSDERLAAVTSDSLGMLTCIPQCHSGNLPHLDHKPPPLRRAALLSN